MTSTFDDVTSIISGYLDPILHSIGLITNSLCVIIFVNIIKYNNQHKHHSFLCKMYHYLLMKTICDVFINFNSVLYYITFKFDENQKSYFTLFMRVYFMYYLKYCSYLASGLFDVMATFDCAISINNRLPWCHKKLFFGGISISILILSLGFESFDVVFFEIQKFEGTNDYNKSFYNYSDVFVGSYKTFNDLLFVDSLIRYFITLGLLLFINIYILIQLIQINKRKNNLLSICKDNPVTQVIANRAKNQKMKMIFFLFVLYVLSDAVLFVYYLLAFINDYSILPIFMNYLGLFGDIISNIPLAFSFFVYLFYNNVFRRFFFRKLESLSSLAALFCQKNHK
jgi:hypothetical protein